MPREVQLGIMGFMAMLALYGFGHLLHEILWPVNARERERVAEVRRAVRKYMRRSS